MNILVTGQVGLKKAGFLEELKELAKSKDLTVETRTIGEVMIDKYVGRIDDATILNLPKTFLDLLRRYAWEDIIYKGHSAGEEGELFIVNSHAVFRWHHGLFPAIDLDLIVKFKPDIVVTIIDDIDKVKKELTKRNTDFFELWEILAWREEEIWFTKFLVDSYNQLSPGKKTDN